MKNKTIYLFALLAILSTSCSSKYKEIEEEIKKTPFLYTVEFSAQVVVTEQDSYDNSSFFQCFENGFKFNANWAKSFFGSRKAMIPIKANLKCGIDWQKLTKDNLSIDGNTVTITLPDPVLELESSKILYHEIITETTGLRDDYNQDDYDRLSVYGKTAILEHNYKEIIALAQENAQIQIKGIMSQLGYQTIFRNKTYSPAEVQPLTIAK